MPVFILSVSVSVSVPSLGIADIFRPFVGYKEVRLVTKDSRHVRAYIRAYVLDVMHVY